MAVEVETYVSGLKIPYKLISDELEGLYGSTLLQEFQEIIEYYNIYEKGAPFIPETKDSDFKSSDLRFRESRKLINREARFLFSKHPDMLVDVPYDKESEDETIAKTAKEQATVLQNYVDSVLDNTNFFSKLLRAAKDCFIGKRVAYFVNFDEVNRKIMIDFVPSLGFVFETKEDDISHLTKIIAFYTTKDSENKREQIIYKKKYWLEDNGVCWMEELLYNGVGEVIEEITPARETKFVNMIPAGVIINDGLTGDLDGVSEIEEIADSESWFSRIANGDIDAERNSMNPILYAMDMNPATTKGLSHAPGAFWDLQSDQNGTEGAKGSVGMLEPSLSYTNAINSTLTRIRSSMLESLDIPDVSAEALQGVVSSGKTLKAIYWSLIVRCDEKMLSWRPALKNILRLIIEGGKLYSQAASGYTDETLPDVEYDLTVDNQYPIPDDEADEKQIDLQEVGGQTMSKLAYMKKWRGLTDAEAMQELRQIAMEREMLEDSYGYGGMGDDQMMPEEESEEPEDIFADEDDTDDLPPDDDDDTLPGDELPDDDEPEDKEGNRLLKMLEDLEKRLDR